MNVRCEIRRFAVVQKGLCSGRKVIGLDMDQARTCLESQLQERYRRSAELHSLHLASLEERSRHHKPLSLPI